MAHMRMSVYNLWHSFPPSTMWVLGINSGYQACQKRHLTVPSIFHKLLLQAHLLPHDKKKLLYFWCVYDLKQFIGLSHCLLLQPNMIFLLFFYPENSCMCMYSCMYLFISHKLHVSNNLSSLSASQSLPPTSRSSRSILPLFSFSKQKVSQGY